MTTTWNETIGLNAIDGSMYVQRGATIAPTTDMNAALPAKTASRTHTVLMPQLRAASSSLPIRRNANPSLERDNQMPMNQATASSASSCQ